MHYHHPVCLAMVRLWSPLDENEFILQHVSGISILPSSCFCIYEDLFVQMKTHIGVVAQHNTQKHMSNVYNPLLTENPLRHGYATPCIMHILYVYIHIYIHANQANF